MDITEELVKPEQPIESCSNTIVEMTCPKIFECFAIDTNPVGNFGFVEVRESRHRQRASGQDGIRK